MKWLFKLFIPKHELPLLESALNASNVWSSNTGKYSFLNKFGNGFNIYTYADSTAILSFVVDGTEVEHSNHRISWGLTQYLISIGDDYATIRAKKAEKESLEDFVKAIHAYGAKINK